MAAKIQFRRGLAANRTGVVFDAGEPAWASDLKQLWMGDGSTAGGKRVAMWGDSPTFAALSITGTVSSSGPGAAFEGTGVVGAPVYLRFDQGANGGKVWRVGNTGAGTYSTFDIHNETDGVTAVSIAPGGAATFASDTVTPASNWRYFGDPATDGTWRMGRSGTSLVHQRREGGVYVTRLTVEGAPPPASGFKYYRLRFGSYGTRLYISEIKLSLEAPYNESNRVTPASAAVSTAGGNMASPSILYDEAFPSPTWSGPNLAELGSSECFIFLALPAAAAVRTIRVVTGGGGTWPGLIQVDKSNDETAPGAHPFSGKTWTAEGDVTPSWTAVDAFNAQADIPVSP